MAVMREAIAYMKRRFERPMTNWDAGTVLLLLVILIVFLSVGHCEAQFIGYVSGQTTQQTVFTAQAANVNSSILTNLGAAAHFLSYCNTGFTGTISLQASPDGTFSSPIILATASYGQNSVTDSACHVLQAGGYFPTVRVSLSNYAAGSVNAWYSSSALPIAFAASAQNSNGPTSPIACDKFGVVQIAQSVSNGILVGLLGASAKIYLCQMTFSFSAATTAGTINLEDGTSGGCTTASGVSNWQLQVTASTPQTLTFGGPLGTFTGTLNPGRCLMVVTGAITASTTISFSYAQQ